MESPGVARQEDWYGCSIISPGTQAPLWSFVPPSLRCGPHLHVHSTFSFQAQRKGKEIDINVRAFSDILSSDSLIFHWPGPSHMPPPLAERGGEIPFSFLAQNTVIHNTITQSGLVRKKRKLILNGQLAASDTFREYLCRDLPLHLKLYLTWWPYC